METNKTNSDTHIIIFTKTLRNNVTMHIAHMQKLDIFKDYYSVYIKLYQEIF